MQGLAKKRITARLCGMSTVIIMLFVLIFFSIANGINGIHFLTASNISTIVNQASFLMIVGIGQAIVILVGGINLSMGAVMAFTTVLCGGMLLEESTTSIAVPIVLILGIGAFIVIGVAIIQIREIKARLFIADVDIIFDHIAINIA